jgi:uncharacterized ion transporter superfamily protein YfcC
MTALSASSPPEPVASIGWTSRFASAFTILFGLIVVMDSLTWLILTGKYQREVNEAPGKDVAIPETYAPVESAPQGLIEDMPMLAPLSDFAGVSRGLAFTACQSACGIVNLVTPTSAVVIGGLAIGRIPYNKWLQFIWPILLVLTIIISVNLSLVAIL